MLVLCAAVLIILVLFATAFSRPSYTSSNVNAPATDTCAGCHNGSAAAGGSAVVIFPSGLTYTPGVTQHLSVKITDPTHTRGGYLLTARLANSISSQAGSFTATDTLSRVIANGAIQDMDAVNFATLTWNFDWTPPAAGVGNVNFYLIGYATGSPGGSTNGNGAYLSTSTLTPGAAGPDFSLSASPSSLSIVQGSSGSSTITVTPLNGFSGSVSFSASGLPSGVTASFNPASATTTSSLTLTASSTATTGTSTVTITGTSGSLSHTTTVALTVSAPPNFSLSASPSSLTVAQSSNGSSTIIVTPQNSFAGSVSLSASGLPSGVTASFSPNPATATSALTLTASATATGTSTVTITGTSGSLSHTTTLALTVSATASPDFSLSASPSSLSIAQGSNGSSTITVAPQNGFAGSVSFSASSLPSGVTASFNPASATTTSSLTLTASFTAATGTFTVTITGTSGSLSHTTTVALTVNATSSTLTATPTMLSFKYAIGSPTPAAQPISVTGSPATLSFTASASAGTWLSVAPMSGTTPGTVNVTVNPGGLTAGTYNGTVSIASSGATGSPQTVQVTLMVSATSTRQLNTTPASSHPNFSIDAKGNYNVAWTDSTAGVFFSRSTDQGTTFPTSVMIQGSAGGAALQPQFVVDASGNNVDVVWAQSTSLAGSYNVLFSRSTDGGQHFATTPTPLTAAALPLADAPRIALEPSGGVDVVWGRNETWAIHSANGATFPTPAVKISTAAQDSGGPRVAVDSKGTIYVAWTDEVNKLATGSYCLQTATSTTTAFTNTVGGNFYFNETAGGSAFDPRNTRNLSSTDWAGVVTRWQFGFFGCSYDNLILLVDAQDNLHMVWSDDMPDEDVLVSAYSAGNSRVSFPANLASSAAASPHAVVVNNSSGIPTLHVVWSDGPGDLTTATSGIFYTHSTDTSAPFGQSFATPPTRVANAMSEFPQVGVDSGGNIDVAWQQSDALIPNAFDVVLAPSFDGGSTFTLSMPVSINASTECLGTNTTDTTQIPPPPYNTCGSVQLKVDSGNASNLVWVDSGSNILFARQTVPPPAGFTMTLNTPSQTATAGTATYTLTLTAENGFNQAVTITCPSGLPAGAACSATQVIPTASGTSATVTVITVSSVPAGTYPFTITGTAGITTHSVQAALVVNGASTPDFSVSFPSSSAMSLQGQTASYTVNIGSIAGFNKSVSITCAGLPIGATCASSPASVIPPGSATVTIAVSGTLAQGTYPFTITGTNGGTNHSQSATLAVGTINATVGPSTSATIAVGSSANFAVSLTSTNGSAGLVSLSCGGVASGLNCAFGPTQLYVSPSGNATTTMTVTVTAKPTSSSVYVSPNGLPNPWTWSMALSALFLITLTVLVAYRRNGTVPAAVIRGLAALALVVVLGAGLISCAGTTGGAGSGASGSNSVSRQFTLQGQSGTATLNLGTMSITVP
jgi:hypothetical protein